MSSIPRELGAAFADEEVVRNYRHRPGYPKELFDVLGRLLVSPRTVLDAGCGTGALTRGLAPLVQRVDAVDPSEAMIREARRLTAHDANIRWICGLAEDAPLSPPYGLITAGASIHWMDPAIVMPRFRDALAPGAKMAIADLDWVHPEDAWRTEFVALIEGYSPVKHHDDFTGLIQSLEAAGLFATVGRHRTAPVRVDMSTNQYLAMLASTSSLSRATLRDRRSAFEDEARGIWERHGISRVPIDVVGLIAWGRPG